MFSGKRFYSIYTALKLHFTTSHYDVIKFKGKGKFNAAKLNEKRYGMLFEQWGSKFQSEKKLGHFIIANVIYGNIDFPYSQNYADAEQTYNKWIKIRDSITKETDEDLQKIREVMDVQNITFTEMIQKTPSGKLPPLLQMALFHKINLETLVIIHKEYEAIFDLWNKNLYNDPYISDKLLMLVKYTPFVAYDKAKIIPLFDSLREKSVS